MTKKERRTQIIEKNKSKKRIDKIRKKHYKDTQSILLIQAKIILGLVIFKI